MAEEIEGAPGKVARFSSLLRRALRSGGGEISAVILKSVAPPLAGLGRLDLIARWVRHVPEERIAHDPHLLYWKGASIVLVDARGAYPPLNQAFVMVREERDGNLPLLAWAALVDAIFLLYRDLSELDPLIAWMDDEREASVDRLISPLKKLVTGSALFALVFRQPLHPRMAAWRERAQRLAEADPASDLGTRLTAALVCDHTWRGSFNEAELALSRFRARAASIALSPIGEIVGNLTEATLRLHQGRLAECQAALADGIAASRAHGIRAWESVLHCHGVSVALSREDIADASTHLRAIEQLFAEGVPVDEGYLRGMLLWRDHLAGDRVGLLTSAQAAVEVTDAKGAPYFSAVSRIAAGLALFKAGHGARGKELLARGAAIGRAIDNPLLAWISGLFAAHMAYEEGDARAGDAQLEAALALGRDHGFAHFFCWPRRTVIGLIDRALLKGYSPEYLDYLIRLHALAPGELPALSDRWAFPIRIYTFGSPRMVYADGRSEPLLAQSQRQIDLLAYLIERGGRPTTTRAIAEEMYSGEDVHPDGALKRILHSLRERVTAGIEQKDGALSIDHQRVWIDAVSFHALRRAGTDAHDVEAWLDRNYHGHFVETVGRSPIVERLRTRYRRHAAHAIRELAGRAHRDGDVPLLERLTDRWQTLFPEVSRA